MDQMFVASVVLLLVSSTSPLVLEDIGSESK